MSKTKESMPLHGHSIEVQRRNAYGTVRVYPVCPLAHGLLDLTGKKTWTDADLAKLEALGIAVDYVLESVDLNTLGGEK